MSTLRDEMNQREVLENMDGRAIATQGDKNGRRCGLREYVPWPLGAGTTAAWTRAIARAKQGENAAWSGVFRRGTKRCRSRLESVKWRGYVGALQRGCT